MKPYLLAVAGSALYVLGYAGFDMWPLAFVALVPVLVALGQLPAGHVRRALRVGLTFGTLVQLGGYSFLLATLREFSGLPLPVCVLVFALLCVAQGGQLALFCVLAYLMRGSRRAWLAFAPFCYTAAELVYPQLFPSPLAASLHPVPILLQPIELLGPTAITLVIAFVNAALAGLVLARLERSRPPLRFAACAALTVALVAGYGAVRMRQEAARVAAAEKVTLGIVQADLGIWQKRRDPREGRRRHIEQSRRLERTAHPALILWPETALVSPVPANTTSLAAELSPLRTPVLLGAVAYQPHPGGTRLYNSAFLAAADGRVLGRTDKVRLIPFAEYIPLGEHFPQLYELSRGSGQLSAGSVPRALVLHGRRIAVLVCYEDVLAGFVRGVVRRTDPALLVDISNDAWFGRTHEPAIHLALSTLRAIEHRRYLVRASNSGPSAVIDPLGRVVAEAPAFARHQLAAEVAWLSGQTVYAQLGDLPGLLAVAVCGFVLLRRRRRPSAD